LVATLTAHITATTCLIMCIYSNSYTATLAVYIKRCYVFRELDGSMTSEAEKINEDTLTILRMGECNDRSFLDAQVHRW
jgi:hypothetical protein